ncbi:MAG TPA: MFS transporter [Terriglobia bacterium]|nr:MFS transporter [Terriglobia bacterium]
MNLLTVQQTTKAVWIQANIVMLMVAISLMSYFDRTIMSIAGPGIMKEFGLSEPQMGAIFTAFLISYACMNLPGGYLADRFGPRLILTLVGLGAGLFTSLTALAAKPGLGVYLGIVPAFFLIRLAMGFCTGPLYPTCARTMGNWIPPTQHARVQGFIAAGAGLGAATSPILFSWMIGTYGWRISFCIAGIVTAILGLIWLWYFRDHPSQHRALRHEATIPSSGTEAGPRTRQKEPTPWKRMLTNPNLMLLALGYFMVCYFEYIYFFWIYYYLGEIRHLGPKQSAVATTVINLAWMVMSPLGGWISDRLVKRYGEKSGRRIIPIVSLTLAGVLLCIGINVTGTVATVSLLALSFGFASFSDGPYWAVAIKLGGKEVGAACGILNMGGNLGGVAPYVAPVIAAYAGWSWGLYSASMLLMVAVLTWFFIDPTKSISDQT